MKRILHIDDDPEVIAIVQHVLGKHYTLVSLDSPVSLVETLQTFRPELVLADNFSELLQSDSAFLQYARISATPVVLFSAAPDVARKAETLQLAGYIEKPASIAYIRTYVERIFARQA